MRHLKVYEHFQQSDYYQEIEGSDFWKAVNLGGNPYKQPDKNKLIRLSQDEIDILGKYSTSHGRGRWSCEFEFGKFGNPQYVTSVLYKAHDEWYYAYFRMNKQYFYYKCDQSEGIEKLFQDWKDWQSSFKKTNESINEELCEEITRDRYNYWRDERYEGLPNDEAKWAMIDSIKKFEKLLAHQSSKLTGKYDDTLMNKAYISGTNYSKFQWEYWRRHSMSDMISDFAFCMFKGEDDYYLINLYINYHQYHIKVDDIIGIKNFYKEFVEAYGKYLW